MNDPRDAKVAIAGSGMSGTLLSLFLAQLGFRHIDVYEKRGDPRTTPDEGSKRTVAMSISARGWEALKLAGLYERLYPNTTATLGRTTHYANDAPVTQNYGRPPQAIYTIKRSILNSALIDSATATGNVQFHFNHQLNDIDLANKLLTLTDPHGKLLTKSYSYLIGADGAFSKVRNLLVASGKISGKQERLDLGYKELSIWYAPEVLAQLTTEYVHVWPSHQSVLVALPSNQDQQFLANLFAPLNQGAELGSRADDVDQYFRASFPSLCRLAPYIVEQYRANPIVNIFTVSCDGWAYEDQVLLLGDAAHAIAPFYAMGMNLCFEDCVKFRQLLLETDLDLGSAILLFESRRRPDTDAMAIMALENFSSLRNSGGRTEKIIWSLERRIWEQYPDRLTPEYVSIALTNRPLRTILQERERRRLDLQNAALTLQMDEF